MPMIPRLCPRIRRQRHFAKVQLYLDHEPNGQEPSCYEVQDEEARL
jgi:hypothetical protein